MILRFIAMAILTEALVELFFKAAPLQGARGWLIKKTPKLRSQEQGHLLDCKYCTSVWVGTFVYSAAFFSESQVLRLVSAALIVARLSNYAHLFYSTVRDAQINMRLIRK